jgi:hypothetical protein
MSGWIRDTSTFSLMSDSTSSWFRYFDVSAKTHNSHLQKVGEIITNFAALLDGSGNSERRRSQTLVRCFCVKASLKELSHKNSFRLSFFSLRSLSTELSTCRKRFLIQSYLGQGTRYYLLRYAWRLFRYPLMSHFTLSESLISDKI